jgi:iron complex transport system permease protein
MTVGSDNRYVIPLSGIAGAMFVVLADTVARVAIAPRELPVGAITALIGAPLFIYLLRK